MSAGRVQNPEDCSKFMEFVEKKYMKLNENPAGEFVGKY